MTIGLGVCPIGVTPVGVGLPEQGTAAGAGVVFPAPPIVAGFEQRAQLDGRAVDPGTKQYVFDVNGRTTGASQVPHLVQLALTTTKGSSAMAALGNDLASIQTIGPNHQQRVEAVVNAALASLVSASLVLVLSVDVQRYGQSGTALSVTYRDLTTGLQQTATA